MQYRLHRSQVCLVCTCVWMQSARRSECFAGTRHVIQEVVLQQLPRKARATGRIAAEHHHKRTWSGSSLSQQDKLRDRSAAKRPSVVTCRDDFTTRPCATCTHGCKCEPMLRVARVSKLPSSAWARRLSNMRRAILCSTASEGLGRGLVGIGCGLDIALGQGLCQARLALRWGWRKVHILVGVATWR